MEQNNSLFDKKKIKIKRKMRYNNEKHSRFNKFTTGDKN